MSKLPRFSTRIDCWMSPRYAALIEEIAAARELTSSAIIREAIGHYLRTIGALPVSPNGQHNPAGDNRASLE
ncbi:ribbon-helix-helix protein, CopG family [Bradyrhizobium sp. GCM10027634]|uniref:ribbon-helix-helix protein, CopG family n=1 Tax=unclassified Bradyrhizobium TaxID=2631580 RepID=UPI00188A42E6|nr:MULTISPECIES: ribbon-helix-helix protein, CopG family [unclassified Bradyrhizobium]MDN5003898.1 ribbon-helix-helix protein, CopG family [Bradyrhizobium sp. WYCCWR 12677]QOZ45440.1 hypothetical protein XH89_19580 [Bradyrhizobium sp. CCBAU 53340]